MSQTYIGQFENPGPDWYEAHDLRLAPGTRIFKSHVETPLYCEKNTRIGPNAVVCRYTGFNEECYIANASIGAFCAVGKRCSINPPEHPTDWLSIHGFQYHPRAFEMMAEYRDFARKEPPINKSVIIGNDVWLGHHVHIMEGVTVGHGAIIGAGAVVTDNVPHYAVVAGVKAEIKHFRFSQPIIDRLLKLEWWNMELSDLSGLPFNDIERCLDMIEKIKAQRAFNLALARDTEWRHWRTDAA